MPEHCKGTTRRAALALGLGTLALPHGGAVHAGRAGLPPEATLLVPGPEDGGFAVWSRRMAEALARAGQVSASVRITPQVLGGPDGVTAANRFATTAAPDGMTLLVLAGAAGQARMVGDKRARFDPAGWLPVCAATVPAVLAVRADRLAPAGEGAAPGERAPPLRVAVGAADSARMAGLLALDLLGVAATPVVGLEPSQAEEALSSGQVEAALLAGPDLPARLAALQARPWFSLHSPAAGWDGLPPELPGIGDLLRRSTAPAPLLAALEVAAAALCLPATVVLPALTGADLVALWRAAAARWIEEESRTPRPGLRLLIGHAAAPLLGHVAAPPPEGAAAYRDWLRRRMNWMPG